MPPSIHSSSILPVESPFGDMIASWYVDLDAHSGSVDHEVLTADELDRAQRMTVADDARRFLASRHALRSILAAYANCSLEHVQYQQSPSGKPTISNANIEFSLSRSKGYALIVCSRRHPVGADIEVLRPVPERNSLMESVFSPAEIQATRAFSGTEADEAFLKTWVKKEACLKATGFGLALHPSRVTLGAEPSKIEVYISGQPDRWRIDVRPSASPPSTVAAIAAAYRR